MTAVALCTVLLTACGGPPTSSAIAPPDEKLVEKYLEPDPSTLRPGDVAVVCLDASGSYDVHMRQAAQEDVADALPGLVRSARAGSTAYVYLIGANTFGSKPAVTITVPPLGKKPVASKSSNPVGSGKVADQIATLTRAWDEAAKRARAAVEPGAQQVRDLAPPQAGGSDIGGCLRNAGDEFARAPAGAGRWLVIASDLIAFGTQQDAGADLTGATVQVIQYKCTKAADCQQRSASTTRMLTTMGVKRDDVTYTRPGQPELLLGVRTSTR